MRIVATIAIVWIALSGAAAAAPPPPSDFGYLEGRVVERVEPADPTTDGTVRALIRLGDGRVVEAEIPSTDPFDDSAVLDVEVGDRVEVYVSPAPGGGTSFVVSDWVRRPALLALLALFFVVTVVVARFKGLRAFVATGGSLAIVIAYIVPQILAGANPVAVSLLGVGGMLVLAIYFVHGVSWSTTAALIGTFAAVLVTMGLGRLFADLAHLTGFGTEEAMMLSASAPQVALQGLLLAALLIGALGALTDITIVQAAVVRELSHANPEFTLRDLYTRGMRVGLDHIGSLVNTLVLAYTGAGLSLFLLLAVNDIPLARALNLELVAAEIVHTLVGSTGLVLAVPLTTVVAGFMFRGDALPLSERERGQAHGHGHGHGHGHEHVHDDGPGSAPDAGNGEGRA